MSQTASSSRPGSDRDNRANPQETSAAPGAPIAWGRRQLVLAALMLAGLMFASYANSFRVPFLFDDQIAILENPTLSSLRSSLFPPPGSGSTVSGRPLLNFTLALNVAGGGYAPAGFHAVNLLIHFLAALCLFGVVRQTLRLPVLAERFGAVAERAAWFAAALWALHPLQTASVTYVVQRAEALAGLCLLFALYAFIRSVRTPAPRWTALTATTCFLGMAAKETMAAAPLLLFLYDRTFLTGSFREAWRLRHRQHLANAAAWLLLLVLVVATGGRGGTVGFGAVTWFNYALAQGPGIAGYLLRAVVPVGLVFDHGTDLGKNLPAILSGCGLVLALLAATAWLLMRRSQAGFLGAWIFLILAPTSSVIPVATQILAEHRMYLPLAALVVAASLLLHARFGKTARWLLPVLVVGCGALTAARNHDYRSPRAIWEDTVRKKPDSSRAHMNLGSLLLADGETDRSIYHLEKALEINPRYTTAAVNLGQAVLAKAKDAGAPDLREPLVLRGLDCLRQAVSMAPENAYAAATLGSHLLEFGQPAEAAAVLQRSIHLQPANAAAHADLARAFAATGRYEEAGRSIRESLRLAPGNASNLAFHGSLLRHARRLPESLATLREAVRLQPELAVAHSQLGATLAQMGQSSAAISHLTEALRLDPSLPVARQQLAALLASEGQPAEALTHAEYLLRHQNPNADFLCATAGLALRAGRGDLARSYIEQALALDPNHAAARQLADTVSFTKE